ncbi:Hypothetical predicted protein [Pelobates cultripes]|uniref:Uncharacterized protein n=1 Tax=Pelobates cultripes TaxID=61616 RepID=A0AAD1TFA4_PELCU|nr:Hypothetical predicted protein [Pelobates cultripes]
MKEPSLCDVAPHSVVCEFEVSGANDACAHLFCTEIGAAVFCLEDSERGGRKKTVKTSKIIKPKEDSQPHKVFESRRGSIMAL